MKFTFGIVTNIDNGVIPGYLIEEVTSIRRLNIAKDSYEIILIGNKEILGKEYNFESHWGDLSIICFNQYSAVKSGWITKMKNMICQQAKYENVVLVHDYFLFLDDWYEGFLKFGNNFNVCITKMINLYVETDRESDRFRDLILDHWTISHTLDRLGINNMHCLVPYSEWCPELSKYCYISGGYIIGKKNFMLKHPQLEHLGWQEGEDVAWSRSIRNNTTFSFNPYSTLKVNKTSNARVFDPMDIPNMQKLKKHLGIV